MKKKCFRYVLAAAALVFAVTAAVSGYEVYKILHEYKKGDDDLERIYAAMESITADSGGPDSTAGGQAGERPGGQGAEALSDGAGSLNNGALSGAENGLDSEAFQKLKAERLSQYRKLAELNEDVIGWIKIDGTVIDYPVMQTPDNPDFYLKHGFDKQHSTYGMIYMDEDCSLEGECRNFLLYGHHMKNGSMFASLEKYTDKAFYEEHPIINFDTLDDLGQYEVVAAFKMPASQITDEFAASLSASTEDDYKSLIQYAKKHGFYDTGLTPQWPEQLLTLATCEYTEGDGRFFVLARKKIS